MKPNTTQPIVTKPPQPLQQFKQFKQFKHVKMVGVALLFGVLSCGDALPKRSSLSAELSLRMSVGGALLQGTIKSSRSDQIIGILNARARTRLMRCSPRCVVIKNIPITRTLLLNSRSLYRIVLGGNYRAGQRVNLIIRFRSGAALMTEVKVGEK